MGYRIYVVELEPVVQSGIWYNVHVIQLELAGHNLEFRIVCMSRNRPRLARIWNKYSVKCYWTWICWTQSQWVLRKCQETIHCWPKSGKGIVYLLTNLYLLDSICNREKDKPLLATVWKWVECISYVMRFVLVCYNLENSTVYLLLNFDLLATILNKFFVLILCNLD